KHGVGQVTLVENRLVGMKSRGVYETPGGTILYEAHKALEQLCLERDLYHYKQQAALKYGELVYYGQWFHPLREALQTFMDHANQVVTGKVNVKLYKGRAAATSAKSPLSLYDTKLASFAMKDYDVTASRGCWRFPAPPSDRSSSAMPASPGCARTRRMPSTPERICRSTSPRPRSSTPSAASISIGAV